MRRRDWLGLVIEIGVVTLGVLLAFEIEQRGRGREQAKEERQFLERLYGEYHRGIDELLRVNGSHEQVMSDFRTAFAARGNAALLANYGRRINFGCGAGYLRTAPFNDTAFAELVSSGRLSMIREPKLRGKIRELTTEQASMKDRAVLGTEAAREQSRLLDPYYRYDLAPDGATHCVVKWSALFDDPQATTAAVRVYRMHELVRSGRVDLMRMTRTVRSDIGCALGKAECRR